MRTLLILTMDEAMVLAGRTPADLQSVLTADSWAGPPLAWTFEEAFADGPPPANRFPINRADPDAAIPGPPEDLQGYIDRRKREIEEGGITLPNGAVIDTTKASQNRVTSAYVLAMADPDEVIEFEAESGWVTLNAPTMVMIGLAVGRHTRTMFKRKRLAEDLLAAGTITTTAQAENVLQGREPDDAGPVA